MCVRQKERERERLVVCVCVSVYFVYVHVCLSALHIKLFGIIKKKFKKRWTILLCKSTIYEESKRSSNKTNRPCSLAARSKSCKRGQQTMCNRFSVYLWWRRRDENAMQLKCSKRSCNDVKKNGSVFALQAKHWSLWKVIMENG